MISRSKKLDLVFTIILITMLIFSAGYQLGYSFTGTTNTFAVGSLETADVNFTGNWFRGTTNVTDIILGQPASLTVSGLTASRLVSTDGSSGLSSVSNLASWVAGTANQIVVGNDGDGTITLTTPQSIGTSSAVTFATVDTGQGANELYDMDQNVLTSSDVVFDLLSATDVNATSDFWRNSANYTSWIETVSLKRDKITIFIDGTNTVAQDNNGEILSNNSDAHTVITAALAQLDTLGGGMLFFLDGVYTINGTDHAILSIPSAEKYFLKGAGLPNSDQSILTSGGAVLSFINGARFEDSAGSDIYVRDLAFAFAGTYTGAGLNWTNNNYFNIKRSMFKFGGTVPAGNAGNPSATLTGNCMNLGRVGGPKGVPMYFSENIINDNRQGTAANNCLIMLSSEIIFFEGNFFRYNFASGLGAANLLFINPISYAVVSGNAAFSETSWDGAGSKYDKFLMTSGGNKNFFINGNQFPDPTDINTAHLYTNSGEMYVYGYQPHKSEAGTIPVDLSVGGSGTVHIRFEGRGYEVWGNATISNGANSTGNIAHGLVGTPTTVSFTGTTNDTKAIWTSTVDGTNIVGNVPANVGGDRIVYYFARYDKTG